MKNRFTGFTEEQIIKVLKESGRTAIDIVRELGIAEQTFYNWMIIPGSISTEAGVRKMTFQ